MAMETESPLFNPSVDMHMEGSFSELASQTGFDHTLTGKPSPGTPSQFLLTPTSLWDRPSFDDAVMDIFADFTEAAAQGSDENPHPATDETAPQAPAGDSHNPSHNDSSVVAESVMIKEESPAPPATVANATRRSTRAVSSSSHARKSAGADKLAITSSNDMGKVKKPRGTTKRPTKKSKARTKESKGHREEGSNEAPDEADGASPGAEPPHGEDNIRRNKFLERNRVAASKCRQKKKEWMQSLEETKNELEKTHTSLNETLNGLLAEISVMKEHLMMHAGCGDPNIDQWFTTEARKFVESKARQDETRRLSTSSGSAETHQTGRSSSPPVPAEGHSNLGLMTSRSGSVTQFSPTSSIVPPAAPSPAVKEEPFSYDYMPDDMFADDKL